MKDLEKKIEAAGNKYKIDHPEYNGSGWAFYEGAKSPEAKEYWQQGIGREISAIINKDTGDLSDGECIDEIVNYLVSKSIYIKKK